MAGAHEEQVPLVDVEGIRHVSEVLSEESSAEAVDAGQEAARFQRLHRVGSRLLVVALAAVGIVAVLHVAIGSGSAHGALRGKPDEVFDHHRAFVQYTSADVARHLEPATRPPVCDRAIVADTCQVMNTETREYFGGGLDANLSVVHAREISEVFMVANETIFDLLNRIKVPKLEDPANPEAFAVECQALCEALVASFPPKNVPNTSDVGCYWMQGQADPVCDADVSPAKLQTYVFKDNGNEKNHYGRDHDMQSPTELTGNARHVRDIITALNAGQQDSLSAGDQKVLSQTLYSSVPFDELRMKLLNMFRVYPVSHATARDETHNIFSPGRRLYTGWQQDAIRLSQEGQAYVSLCLKRMANRQIPNIIDVWFGNNQASTRQEIKRVLNGLTQMLGNVEYRLGPDCQPNYYAYVYPNPPHNKNYQGQFIFYLCDVYFRVNEAEKIQTLTHEGAHHLQMLTDDHFYGTSLCKSAATQCRMGNSQMCAQALDNADTFCYFISDGATVGGLPPANPLPGSIVPGGTGFPATGGTPQPGAALARSFR